MTQKRVIFIGSILIIGLLFFSIMFLTSFFPNRSQNKSHAIINGITVDDYLYLLDYDKFDDRTDVLTQIKNSEFDLIIMDTFYSDDASWFDSEVNLLKNSNGETKIVVSYLSIGEAEDYRYYWNDSWVINPPDWLDEENPDWEGNYRVNFWDPEWQKIVYDYIENRSVKSGFDGLFLDTIDTYYYYECRGVENAEELMVDFVCNISRFCYSDLGLTGFLIIPQNGESLGYYSEYLNAISGLAMEDIFYDDDTKNSQDLVDERLEMINQFLENDKFVLSTDYCREPDNIRDFYTLAYQNGLIPYATIRSLDEIIINTGYEPD